MPRVCTVCACPDRPAIDKALVAGDPVTKTAALFRVSEDAVQRHKTDHLPATLVKAAEQEDVRHAIDHIAQLKAINAATIAILHEARQQRDADTALKAIDRIQKQIELQAKLIGELDDRPQINVLVLPEWLAIRSALLAALAPYPEARAAVVEAINGHSG